MPNTGDVLDTVDLLYRAAIAPELWPDALEVFSHSVGCIGMAMIPITPNQTTGLVVSPSMRDVETEYQQGWCHHDTRVGRIFSRGLSDGVVCEPELFDQAEIARDPFRQEFCRKWGIGVFAAQLIAPWPGQVVAFSAQRSLGRGHFERDEIDRLNLLGQHAARALTIARRLAAGHGLANGLLDVIDRFDGGVFVVDRRVEVVLSNGCADRMLGDGLSVTKRRLLAATPERQKHLDALIASALDRSLTAGPVRPIALPRPSGKKPLLAQALPLTSRQAADGLGLFMEGTIGALVLVIDPDTPAPTTHECLRLLGLTPAEARLAALVGTGMRRHDAAAILGVSDWTAHTALKHIYSKLNVASQGELVRLVGRLAVAEPWPVNGG